MDIWPVFLVAAATLVWTIVAFFLNRRHVNKTLTAQLDQNASITSREQFTGKLQHAIGLCLAESNDSKRMGLTLLYDLMVDSAARASDQELAGRVADDVNRQLDEGEGHV